MKKHIARAAAALLILAPAIYVGITAAPAAIAVKPEKTYIDALDTMSYDGETLAFSYSVFARCEAAEYETFIGLTVEKSAGKTKKTVNSVTVEISDVSPEHTCASEPSPVSVSSKANLTKSIDKEMDKWVSKGYTISKDLSVTLPSLRRPVAGGYEGSVPAPGKSYGGAPLPTPQNMNVTYIEYQPQWKCTLYKHDGARKDGFTGAGGTIDAARQGAISGCARTNNPHCQDYAVDPAHTTCDVQILESTRDEVVPANSAPLGARSMWTCIMNKYDGSAGDGFKATAETEDAARMAAANLCKRTNNSRCDNFAYDADHTSCSQALVVAGPKPSVSWRCTLYKRDGARKDGFAGSGGNELEARRDTIAGCMTTNNPYCEKYAMDPAHTPCSAELVYPQEQ